VDVDELAVADEQRGEDERGSIVLHDTDMAEECFVEDRVNEGAVVVAAAPVTNSRARRRRACH